MFAIGFVNGVENQAIAHEATIYEDVDAVAMGRWTSGREVKP